MVFGGFALFHGAAAGLAFATTKRRSLVLIWLGGACAALFFGYRWATAPRSSEDAGYVLSDGGDWLGRYWEGWLVALFAVMNWIGWTVGIGVGAFARWRSRVHRELREQRGAVPGRH